MSDHTSKYKLSRAENDEVMDYLYSQFIVYAAKATKMARSECLDELQLETDNFMRFLAWSGGAAMYARKIGVKNLPDDLDPEKIPRIQSYLDRYREYDEDSGREAMWYDIETNPDIRMSKRSVESLSRRMGVRLNLPPPGTAGQTPEILIPHRTRPQRRVFNSAGGWCFFN